MSNRQPARFLSFTLALLMTVGMLGGVDRLAVIESAHAAGTVDTLDAAGAPLVAHAAAACTRAPRA